MIYLTRRQIQIIQDCKNRLRIIDNREISLESQELVARLYQDIVNLINIIENNENLEVL